MDQENVCNIKRTVATKFLKLPWASMLKCFLRWRSRRPTSTLSPRYIYNQCQINVDVTGGVMNAKTIVQQYSSNTVRKIIFRSRYFGKGSEDGGPGEEDIEHVDSVLIILRYLHAFCMTDYFPLLQGVPDVDGH